MQAMEIMIAVFDSISPLQRRDSLVPSSKQRSNESLIRWDW